MMRDKYIYIYTYTDKKLEKERKTLFETRLPRISHDFNVSLIRRPWNSSKTKK